MSFLSWLNEVLDGILRAKANDGSSSGFDTSVQHSNQSQRGDTTVPDSEPSAAASDGEAWPTDDATPEVPSNETRAGKQPQQPPLPAPQEESEWSSHGKGNTPSRYLAIWKEAKQIAAESDTKYSIDEYHPDRISAGNWVSALEDLETVIEQETSVEADSSQPGQDSSTGLNESQERHDQQDKANTDSSQSSSADEPRVPIKYQQLWSNTNRLLEDVDYEESLAELHPDSVSAGQWDTAYGACHTIVLNKYNSQPLC